MALDITQPYQPRSSPAERDDADRLAVGIVGWFGEDQAVTARAPMRSCQGEASAMALA